MALLKPSTSIISDILNEAGIGGTPEVLEPEERKNRAANALNAVGLDLKQTAQNLRELTFADKEETRLNANKIAFQIHGVLNDKSTGSEVPNITFILKTQNNTNLMNILSPR